MALRMWASSTANALKLSTASSKPNLSPAYSLSRCFSSVLEGLKYAKSHEWVKCEGSVATIGITDHAQDHLGEVVFVELPDVGGSVKQGGSFGAVESVKATSDVNSPISGEVVEVNAKLTETPGTFQSGPDIIGEQICHLIPNVCLDGIGTTVEPAEGTDLSSEPIVEHKKINSSPYEDGWMIKIKPSDPSELGTLMGPKEYTKFCEEEDH